MTEQEVASNIHSASPMISRTNPIQSAVCRGSGTSGNYSVYPHRSKRTQAPLILNLPRFSIMDLC